MLVVTAGVVGCHEGVTQDGNEQVNNYNDHHYHVCEEVDGTQNSVGLDQACHEVCVRAKSHNLMICHM